MKNKKIVIAGGTGFMGQELIKYFGKENYIVILGRQVNDHHKNLYKNELITASEGYNVQYIKWDGKTVDHEWLNEINGSDIVINLAGKSVNCRYHAKQKRQVLESRIHSTHVIGEAIRRCLRPPALWINLSSATIYHHTYDHANDEFTGIISGLKKDNMPYSFLDRIRRLKNKIIIGMLKGKISPVYKEIALDFSVSVCKAWERAFYEEKVPFTRKVAMRTAVALGENGVMTPFFNLCKFGLGGKQGSGKQMFSWVHMEDVARMIKWFYTNEKTEGIYNCVAPNVVSNYSFMKTLRSVTGHKFGLPALTLLLELGTFLIGSETELILKSRWVLATRAKNEGFEFKYKMLEDALTDIVAATPRKQYHLF